MNLNEVEDVVNRHYRSVISEARKTKIITALKDEHVEILWHLAFRFGSDSKVPIKCLVDGEYSIYFSSHLTRGVYSCGYCLDEKHKNLFAKKGFKYLSKTIVNGTSIVSGECFKCKTTIKGATGNLHNRYNFICPVCEHNKMVDALALKQCEYVSVRLVNYLQRITYKNKDGELFENLRTNILRGSFTSGGSHWDQKHHLYLIVCKFNDNLYYKIGTANNPKNRLASLKLSGETSVSILNSFESRYDASKQEKCLHKLFKDFNIGKDTASLFTNGLSKIGKKMGVTEWFTADILPELKQIYKEQKEIKWQ